jgi:hypothetical protein
VVLAAFAALRIGDGHRHGAGGCDVAQSIGVGHRCGEGFVRHVHQRHGTGKPVDDGCDFPRRSMAQVDDFCFEPEWAADEGQHVEGGAIDSMVRHSASVPDHRGSITSHSCRACRAM